MEYPCGTTLLHPCTPIKTEIRCLYLAARRSGGGLESYRCQFILKNATRRLKMRLAGRKAA
jgi:hypothetical protein